VLINSTHRASLALTRTSHPLTRANVTYRVLDGTVHTLGGQRCSIGTPHRRHFTKRQRPPAAVAEAKKPQPHRLPAAGNHIAAANDFGLLSPSRCVTCRFESHPSLAPRAANVSPSQRNREPLRVARKVLSPRLRARCRAGYPFRGLLVAWVSSDTQSRLFDRRRVRAVAGRRRSCGTRWQVYHRRRPRFV